MKKIVLVIVSMIILAFAYGQEIKVEKDKFKLIAAGKVKSTPDKAITLLSDYVIIEVPNKLNIEADSAQIDKNQNLLIAYGTKSFTFNGKVVIGKENTRTCRFRLGEDTLIFD